MRIKINAKIDCCDKIRYDFAQMKFTQDSIP